MPEYHVAQARRKGFAVDFVNLKHFLKNNDVKSEWNEFIEE